MPMIEKIKEVYRHQATTTLLNVLTGRRVSITSQKLKRSCDPKHIPLGNNLSRVRQYSTVSICTLNPKCLVSHVFYKDMKGSKIYNWVT